MQNIAKACKLRSTFINSKRFVFGVHCSMVSSLQFAAAGYLLQKYASLHTANDTGKATPHLEADESSSPVHGTQLAKQDLAPAAAHKGASKCQKSSSSTSDRSHSSGCRAPGPKQRKRRHETPAFLADPLGAFACQASQRQRTLQSGLSMLKGKASQTRIVAPNLRSPNEQPAAQLDTYRFQPASTAMQLPAQPIKSHNHAKGRQAEEQHPQQQGPDLHKKARNNHQKAQIIAKPSRSPLAELQPPGQSQSGISHSPAQDMPSALRQFNANYFRDLKHSLHTLIQANHAIPSLHTMSDTDKAALTTLLANKLDGVSIHSDLQGFLSSKLRAGVHSAKQQPSAASSVDCTPSPVPVAQHKAKPCKLPKLTPLDQRVQTRAMPTARPSVHASHTSHASAAISGSGHRPVLTDGGCFDTRQTAAGSGLGLFDLHAEPMHARYSLGQEQGQTHSRNSDANSLDADVAGCCGSPRINWYASPLDQAKQYLKQVLGLGCLPCKVISISWYCPMSCDTFLDACIEAEHRLSHAVSFT